MSDVGERVSAESRFDRPTLVSFLAVGMAWLVLPSLPWGDGPGIGIFSVGGVLYVICGAFWWASNARRMPDTAREQVVVPGVLWSVAVAFWFVAWLNLGITAEKHADTGYLVNGVSVPEDVAMALFTGTVSFFMWLLPALGIRGAWRWIARE